MNLAVHIFRAQVHVRGDLIFAAVALATQAQTSVYHPFPDSDATWCNSWRGVGGSIGWNCADGQITIQADGQVIINGLAYTRLKKIQISQLLVYPWQQYICDSVVSTSIDTTPYYIRQDTALKKVWIYNAVNNVDSIFYDFDLHIGDTLDGRKVYWNEGGGNEYRITSIDSVLINGSYRKRYSF